MGKNNIIIDTDFSEVNSELNNDNNINKKPLYYTCKQVSQIVEETESTIRYWAKAFESILNIEVSNMVKRYTKTDIENLLFIKKLKEDGMTIKQIYDYCSEKGFNQEEKLVDTSNPLAIQIFIKALTVEIDEKFKQMYGDIITNQQQLVENLTQEIENNNAELNESIARTVDEVVTDKMDEYFESINRELAINRETNEKIDKIRESMESRRIENDKKGLFSRLFNK